MSGVGLVLGDFNLGDALLTVLGVFLLVAWIWILVAIISDLFGDHGMSGWGKAAWVLVLLVFPFLGTLVYLIARGGSMQERAAKHAAEARKQFEGYVRETAAASPADELAKLAALRDKGTISQAEFDQMKAKLLS